VDVGPAVTTLTNTFSGGTSGTSITTGNSGGASGNAFDTIDAAFGGTCTYSNAEAHAGSLSGLMTMPGSAVAAVGWNTSLTSGTPQAQVWFRVYCYFPAYAAFNNDIVQCYPASGFGCDLSITTGGSLEFKDSNGTPQITSSTVLSTGTWYRLEGYVIGSLTAGQMQLQVFTSPDSATPAETETSGSSVNTGGLISIVNFGIASQGGAGGAFTEYLDGLGASTTGYLGPIGPGPGPSVTGIASCNEVAALIAAGII
jgi:hypothetical protein